MARKRGKGAKKAHNKNRPNVRPAIQRKRDKQLAASLLKAQQARLETLREEQREEGAVDAPSEANLRQIAADRALQEIERQHEEPSESELILKAAEKKARVEANAVDTAAATSQACSSSGYVHPRDIPLPTTPVCDSEGTDDSMETIV